MGSTLPLEELEKYSDNIYEAIVVLGKRARQINDEQKNYIEREAGIENSFDDEEDDEFFDRELAEAGKTIKLPKPTQLAIDEFISGKLQYDYGEDVEGEQSDK